MKTSASQLSRYLFLFTAAVLVILGVGSLTRIGENPDRVFSHAIYTLLMFVDAAFMLFCAFQLHRKNQKIYRLAVGILVLHMVATIFDPFGFADLLFVLLNLTTLIALLMARKEFLPA